MTAAKLALVPRAPTNAELIASTLTLRATAEAALKQCDTLLNILGPRYLAEKYPDAREFVRPSVERLRREIEG